MTDDRPAVGLKHGGGRGRTGGFGYLYQQEFAQPFERALAMTIRSHNLPPNDVFEAAYTTMILEVLKASFAEHSRPVHEKLKKEGGKTMQCNSVSDMIRLFVFGVYDRDRIPLYIGMASANTCFMVYSKFVAVGMNKRIIHLNHANIIEMELSGVIGVEEHGNVA